MTEHQIDLAPFSQLASKKPLFDLITDDSSTTLKYKETRDPSVLINIMHRIVANSNHTHPRILCYQDYTVDNCSACWKVGVKLRKMETNLTSLILSKYYSNTSFSKVELLNHYYSLLSALEYLHRKGIPHQNIKPENILFDSDQSAYLSDLAHRNEIQGTILSNEASNLYTNDMISLGKIFLRMCDLEIENAANTTLEQKLEKVQNKYGKDVSDLIYQMIRPTVAGKVTAQTLRQVLEETYQTFLRPISAKPERFDNMKKEQGPSVLKSQMSEVDVLKQEIQIEPCTKKRAYSIELLHKNYMCLPWRLSKGPKTVAKYGVLKKRELDNLKKCSKIGSCRGVEKVGKKIGVAGLELVQSNNKRTPANCKRNETSKLQQLSQCWSKFVSLKDFQIDFTCDNINCQDLVIFGKNLLRLKLLKKLRIGFSCGQTLGDNDLAMLGGILHRVRKLEDLNLYLNRWTKVTDRGFKQFCYSLSKVTKLKRLVLNIEEFQNIGHTSIVEFGQALAKLPQLTELDLTLYRCSSIAGPQLAALSESLTKLTSIKKLAINMKQTQGSIDQGLIGISNAFSTIPDLRELRLNFLNCDLTEESIVIFGKAVGQLAHLNLLDLTFGNNQQINNNSFEPLALSIGKLSQLRTLRLVFFQCDKLTNGAVYYISEALTNLHHLGELDLNFRWCTSIDDYGISRLGEALLNLNYLHRLQLSLDGCRISDNGVSKLGQDLAKLQYLSDLKLEVRECKRIQGSGISKLGECLTKLVELGQIQLNFCGCGGNYRQRFSEGIISLKKSISKLPRVNMNETSVAPSC